MNHYELLGVDRSVSREELARAYRKLARQHHPDRNSDDAAESTRRMVEINEAFEVLSDPVRRFDYNRSLDAGTAAPATSTDARDSRPGRARPKRPPDDDPDRRARREAKERAAAEARRRGYRDPTGGGMSFRAPD